MIIFLNILIFIITVYLQSSILGRYDIFGFSPNIILILMVAFALYRRTYESYAFAFVFGMMLDSLSSGPFGVHTAIFMLTVFASNLVVNEDHSNITGPLAFVVLGASATVFYLTLWLSLSLQSKSFTIAGLIFTLGEVAITFGFFVLIFPYLRKLFSWEKLIYDRRGR